MKVGHTLPAVPLHVLRDNGMPSRHPRARSWQGRVVLFGVPCGASTPGCSKVHLPGFVERQGELREKGVDTSLASRE